MKKAIALVIIVSLLSMLVACGKTNQPTSSSTSETEKTISNPDSTNEETNNSTDKNNLLSNTFKIPGKEIYVDVPNYQQIDKGFTKLFILNGERYVALTYDKSATVSTVAEAHETAFNIFKDNIQNYSYVNSLEIAEDATNSINGIQVYRFVGKLNCALDYSNREKSYDAYAIGYSFIMDGVPCSIIGSIVNQDQKTSDINEITDIVDAMIQTLRNTR